MAAQDCRRESVSWRPSCSHSKLSYSSALGAHFKVTPDGDKPGGLACSELPIRVQGNGFVPHRQQVVAVFSLSVRRSRPTGNLEIMEAPTLVAVKNLLTRRVCQLWIATRVGIWLCLLPVRLRTRSFPELLAGQAHLAVRRWTWPRFETAHTIKVVQRVSGLSFFRASIFPRTCLRESLALYHVLRSLGYPVRIHIGVRKDGSRLAAHSWVTLEGESVGAPRCDAQFRTLYSYPATGPTRI